MFKYILLCLACLLLPLNVQAAPFEAEPLTIDEAALMGVYTGNGAMIVVGEAGGALQVMDGYIPNVNPKEQEQGKLYPLTREHYNAYTYKDAGPKKNLEGNVDFERDKNGQGVSLRLDGRIYTRRFEYGENGQPFRIKPEKSMAELRKEAAAALPPKLKFTKTADLVDLATAVPNLHFALHYTTSNNIFGAPLVLSKKAYLDRNATQALIRVQKDLQPYGYGLVVWEAYRSWSDFKLATLALGQKYKNYLPRAEKGFSHNTGCAIAVSLYELSSGEPVPMICDFDAVSPAQYSDFPGGTELQRWQRDLLREQMAKEGFEASKNEWWHFDFDHKTKYEILNIAKP